MNTAVFEQEAMLCMLTSLRMYVCSAQVDIDSFQSEHTTCTAPSSEQNLILVALVVLSGFVLFFNLWKLSLISEQSLFTQSKRV